MLAAYFAGSLLLAVASVLQWINYPSTDEAAMKYFFAIFGIFWAIMAFVFGMDLFKGDVIVMRAKVIEVKNKRVWFQWETGRKTSVSVGDPDTLKQLSPGKTAELILTKRTKQLKKIQL